MTARKGERGGGIDPGLFLLPWGKEIFFTYTQRKGRGHSFKIGIRPYTERRRVMSNSS